MKEVTMGDFTILGAGGIIAGELGRLLVGEGETVRMVSRSGASVPGAAAVRADVTEPDQTIEAVGGSSTVILCVGLKYDYRVWRELWPRIMSGAIEACVRSSARLVFFDNVYAYGKVDGEMTESTPYDPCSKKGEVRAQIAGMLMDRAGSGGLEAMIVRSADFYGPSADTTGLPNILVFGPLARGKKARCLVSDRTRHSYTFIPDTARALSVLSRSRDAYNQIWHLPTASDPLTGGQFIEAAAEAFHTDANYSILSKWMVRTAGMFNRDIAEMYEMLYQNEHDYLFDSSKIRKAFGLNPTSYHEGISSTAGYYTERSPGR
jgi:nucleoside-diphosphate-sugar epimerase